MGTTANTPKSRAKNSSTNKTEPIATLSANWQQKTLFDASGDSPERELLEQPPPGSETGPVLGLGNQHVTPSVEAANVGSIAEGEKSTSGQESDSDGCPPGLKTVQQIEQSMRVMLDAPIDLPAREDALIGLAEALRAMELELPSVAQLQAKIHECASSVAVSAADGGVVVSLSRRKGIYLTYGLARELGAAIRNHRQLDTVLLKVFGIHCVRRLIANYQPTASSIAKIRQGLLYPQGRQAQGWSAAAQARALNKARVGLNEALQTNRKAAAEYGLAAELVRLVKPQSPIAVFNKLFRRRVENLIDFSTLDAVAAAGGYGTLSKAGLLYAGRKIMNKAQAGDRGALLVALEIVSHIPSAGVLLIPIKRGATPPAHALGWLDLESGSYCQVLYRILERGAKVEAGKAALYETTTQVVTIRLSPPFLQLLLEMDRASKGVATNVEGLTGPVGHHPRAAVVEGGGYRVTARRMQESLPTLLLQEGQHRWPVALATNSHFLVTRGRRAYGACSSDSIHKVTERSCELLGWPKPAPHSRRELIGTPTVPTSESITRCLNFFCDRADNIDPTVDSFESVCEFLRVHAEWFAMLLALALALRRWLTYEINFKEVRAGGLAKFNDKEIHEHQGPGVPVLTILCVAANEWVSLCRESVVSLRMLVDASSIELADKIESALQGAADGQVFSIDALGHLTPIGYKTWFEVLPDNIRLQPNFSRQFWPLKLMEQDVEQVVMDYLMRHQFDSIPPGTSRSLKTLNRSMATLAAAMEAVIATLNLQTPKKLKGARDEK